MTSKIASRTWIARSVILVTTAGLVAACAGQPAADFSSPTRTESPSLAPSSGASQSAPTIRQGTWTSLRWSAPADLPDQALFSDVVAWRDSYVAVGEAPGANASVGAAFVSADGLQWQRTTDDASFSGIPRTVVATTTRLIAFGRRSGSPESLAAWTSADGRIWEPLDGLALSGVGVVGIAQRERTLVAGGADESGRTSIWRSVDVAPWTAVRFQPDHAIVRGVVSVSDGFIAFGREGEPDAGSGGVGAPGVGRPAAWWSADGQVWSAVPVEGVDAAGAQLTAIFSVADGLFAVGSDNSSSPRSASLWTSTDGREWRLIGPPTHWGFAGFNGRQAVVLGFGGVGADPEGWTSLDGRLWTPLEFAGDATHIPVTQQFVGMSGHIDHIFVMPRGVLVIGQVVADQRGRPAVWFAEASTR